MDPHDQINILLVDDSPEKLFALTHILKPLGQNLVEAHSGEEALRLLLKQDFALILLDVRMPGMDGFETAELIRSRKSCEYTPIIFVTGIDRSETQAFKGYSKGAVDYLFTPVVKEVLLAKVSVFIELYRKTQLAKRSQKLLAEAQQIAHLGSWKWILADNRMLWSEEFCRIFGLLQSESGDFETFLSRIDPADRESLKAQLELACHDLIPVEQDCRILGRDDEPRAVYLRGMVSSDASGRVTDMVGTVLDITDRKQAEEALRASEERFRSVTETALSAIITAREDGTIVHANQSAARIYGWPMEQLISKQFSTLFPERCRFSACVQKFDCAKLEGKTAVLCSRKRDGSEFPVELSMARWKSHDNQILYTAIISDITEREAAERKLEAEVQERKAAEEKILEISGREQRHLGEELHDGLGQTLTGISFLAKVLAQKLAAAGVPEAKDAERISTLVSEAISKTREMSRGFYPVELESNGLVSALNELAARERNIFGIECNFETSETAAVADLNKATQVYRIAQEAIENAIKHGKAKTVWIKLEKSGSQFNLTVRDDGIGFPDALPKKRGMGLQIMKYRAGMINGTFEIQRHGQRGTLVACTFPDSIDTKK